MKTIEEVRKKMWAVRPAPPAAEIWDEDGKFVARFANIGVATEIVDEHNFEVELDEPEAPEVILDRKVQQAERLAVWRKEDPEGADLVNLIISCAARVGRLLSLKAPEVVVSNEVQVLFDRAALLLKLHPTTSAGDGA